MIHAAHASRHHWSQIGTAVNFARGEWQISRVYAVLGRAEPAIYHGRRSLEICQANGIGDFDFAFAHEAIARGAAIDGDEELRDRHLGEARDAADRIASADDRQYLLKEVAGIPGA